MIQKCRVILVATCFILCPTLVLGDENLDAIALVVIKGKDGESSNVSRTGSGFLVGQNGAVVTAYHTVATPQSGWEVDDFGIKDFQITILLRDPTTGLLTDARPASVKEYDTSIDTALLEVGGYPRSGLSSCPEPSVAMGDILKVVAVEPGVKGQPHSLDPRVGAVSEWKAKDAPFIRASVATKQGFSGGPAFKTETNGKGQLIGMLKGGDPLDTSTHSLIVPISAMREKILGACDVPCAHPDHGVDHYRHSTAGNLHVSDWQRGGSDPTKYCDSYAAAERRRLPDTIVTVIHAYDNNNRFFTGWRGNQYIVREAQYKFECRLRYDSDPVYITQISTSCPKPLNPLNLPT